jgi:hypothetical protein
MGVKVGLGNVLRKRGLFYGLEYVRACFTCLPMIAMQDIRGAWDIGPGGFEFCR